MASREEICSICNKDICQCPAIDRGSFAKYVKRDEIREIIGLYTNDECLYPDTKCKSFKGAYCISGEDAYKCLMKRLDGLGVVIKDRDCGVSHQRVWVKIFSVRSLIDGEVELFDGYGIEEK